MTTSVEERRASARRFLSAAWHDRKRAAGLCYDCGKPADGKWRCERCRERVNRYRRERGYR